MNQYRFSRRSLDNLDGVHVDLIVVVTHALTLSPVDFVVTEGLRTRERQQQLVKAGASQTMNSRHLTGHAIDVAALLDGEVRWDWPLYNRIANAMSQSSERFGIPITWGGSFQTLKDGPHFQLDWEAYPAS